MFDFDLTRQYKVETRALKQPMKPGIDRFPNDFIFQPSKPEWQSLSQIVMTYSVKHLKTSLQLAFTKGGISMFTSVFKSKIARLTSIATMSAFYVLLFTSYEKQF
jgi:hypothetical protein